MSVRVEKYRICLVENEALNCDVCRKLVRQPINGGYFYVWFTAWEITGDGSLVFTDIACEDCMLVK